MKDKNQPMASSEARDQDSYDCFGLPKVWGHNPYDEDAALAEAEQRDLGDGNSGYDPFAEQPEDE